MSPERRRHPRVEVGMWVEEQHDTELYFRRSANLSPGGLFLAGSIPHRRGARLVLSFQLPGEPDEVRVHGEVVGDPEPGQLGMHVKFVGLDPALADRLRALAADPA